MLCDEFVAGEVPMTLFASPERFFDPLTQSPFPHRVYGKHAEVFDKCDVRRIAYLTATIMCRFSRVGFKCVGHGECGVVVSCVSTTGRC